MRDRPVGQSRVTMAELLSTSSPSLNHISQLPIPPYPTDMDFYYCMCALCCCLVVRVVLRFFTIHTFVWRWMRPDASRADCPPRHSLPLGVPSGPAARPLSSQGTQGTMKIGFAGRETAMRGGREGSCRRDLSRSRRIAFPSPVQPLRVPRETAQSTHRRIRMHDRSPSRIEDAQSPCLNAQQRYLASIAARAARPRRYHAMADSSPRESDRKSIKVTWPTCCGGEYVPLPLSKVNSCRL